MSLADHEKSADKSLLELAAKGDEAAFLRLYERHSDAVYRFAYRLLGVTEAAEDITHDCFLSLLRRPAAYDARRATLRTYLLAAARNLALKYFRQQGLEVIVDEWLEEPPARETSDPLRQVLDNELAAEVRQAVLNLSPLQREALVLFEYEELSLAEVAIVTGADVGTVKARLRRARQNLKRLLKPYREVCL